MSDDRIALVPVQGAVLFIAAALYEAYGGFEPRQLDAVLSALGLDREDWPTRGDFERAAWCLRGSTPPDDSLEVYESDKATASRIEKALG